MENEVKLNENTEIEAKQKTEPTSFRLTKDTKEKLQKQLKDLNFTQESYFNRAVSLMELENVKEDKLLYANVNSLQVNLDAILKAFINIADNSNNLLSSKDRTLQERTEEILNIRNECKEKLLNKENEIQEKTDELQSVYVNYNTLQKEIEGLKIENDKQMKQLEENLKDKTLIVEEYKEKNDTMTGLLNEYKQYKTDIEYSKKLLVTAQSKIAEHEITLAKNGVELDSLKQINTENIKQFGLDKKIAVADAKEELTTKHNIEVEKHNAKIEEYQREYKAVLKELEQERKARAKDKNEGNKRAE